MMCVCLRNWEGCVSGWDSGGIQGKRKERRGSKEGGEKKERKQGTKTQLKHKPTQVNRGLR